MTAPDLIARTAYAMRNFLTLALNLTITLIGRTGYAMENFFPSMAMDLSSPRKSP